MDHPEDHGEDWLAKHVTDEAKEDPDWRRKALTGRGPIRPSEESASPPAQDGQAAA